MAISFNQKLSSNSTSSYKLDEFNGVDYTTTPTKVSDNRAIDISNYLPEGNSLVKRYGYEKILDFCENGIQKEYTYESKTYAIKDTVKEVRVVTFSNLVLVLIGRKLTDGVYVNDFVFFENNNNNLVYRATHTLSYTRAIGKPRDYRCEKSAIVVRSNTVYAFVFGDYFIIKNYEYTNMIGATFDTISISNVGKFYDETSYLNGNEIITPYYQDYYNTYKNYGDNTYFTATDDENKPYIPTLALNYQPIESTSKNIPFQQLNMLSYKFKVELNVTLKANMSGDVVSGYAIQGNTYDLETLVGIDSNLYDCNNASFQMKFRESETIGFTFNITKNGGKLMIDFASSTGANNGTGTLYDSIATGIFSNTYGDYLSGKITLTFGVYRNYNMGFKDLITSKVGTLYGVKNSADRIFVGNTDNAPNTDWHTLDDENGNPDFTYFGTDTYNAIGSGNSEIIGYSLLNDGSLAIFKDNTDVSNIFVRTGNTVISNEEYSVFDYINNTNVKYSYVKAVEQYPTISTGLLVKTIDKNTKFTLYDNKLIFSDTNGVYYLNLNSATASQSYSAKELSYYIRNDLSSNIENSTIITDGKYLYVARENKDGQLRVYVADKNRYSFINSEAQYDWWILDGIPMYKAVGINNKVYFIDNELNMYKFTNDFVDKTSIKTNSVKIGGETFNTEIMFDTEEDKLVIDTTNSSTWQKLMDIYKYNAAINKDNEGSKYSFIKNNVSIKFDTDIYMKLNEMFDISNVSVASKKLTFDISISDTDENQKYKEFVSTLDGKVVGYDFYNYKITNITTFYVGDNIVYSLEGITDIDYDLANFAAIVDNFGNQQSNIEISGTVSANELTTYDNAISYVLNMQKGKKLKISRNFSPRRSLVYKITNIATLYGTGANSFSFTINLEQIGEQCAYVNGIYLLLKNELLNINDLYTTDNKKLSNYVYIDNAGWFSPLGDFVGTTLDFKTAKLEYNGLLLDIYNSNDSQTLVNNADTTFYVNAPISSYWYGKFTDLGTIDTLKSTKAIHFVPETRRGGYTTIGYRTRKTRQFNSDTTNLTTIRKYLVEYAKERSMNVRERMYNSLDLGINLNDIDFNNFSFESDYFARTYSSKKKIKNFAFIQLKFESPKAEDSTIAELSIQFQYTKNNKGVK